MAAFHAEGESQNTQRRLSRPTQGGITGRVAVENTVPGSGKCRTVSGNTTALSARSVARPMLRNPPGTADTPPDTITPRPRLPPCAAGRTRGGTAVNALVAEVGRGVQRALRSTHRSAATAAHASARHYAVRMFSAAHNRSARQNRAVAGQCLQREWQCLHKQRREGGSVEGRAVLLYHERRQQQATV